jgi:hypothetical protein
VSGAGTTGGALCKVGWAGRGSPKAEKIATEQGASGKSEVVEVPTDVLAMATRNNLRIDGDMTRRVLICRIDPETERPELRKFANDPLADAKAGRPRLVGAASSCFGPISPPPQADHPLGSYEDWSDLVRSTLMWLGEADPVETMERAMETDPRLDEKRAVTRLGRRGRAGKSHGSES